MEYHIKSYVKRIYPNKIIEMFGRTSYYENQCRIEEISERNPLNVKNDPAMIGFCFFDRYVINDGRSNYICEDIINTSGMIYLGRRYSLDQIRAYIKFHPEYKKVVDDMIAAKCDSVCFTRFHEFVLMKDGDMTYEEYIEQSKQRKFKK